MPRARVYRHDRRCPHCGSNWVSKHGFGQGRQVYRCGDCRRRQVEGASYHRSSPEVVDRIMALYGEGMSLRAIGRAVGLSGHSVYFWVKKSRCRPVPAEPGAPPPAGGEPAHAQSQAHIL